MNILVFIISLVALLTLALMFFERFKPKKVSPLKVKDLELKTERLISSGDIKKALRELSPYSKTILNSNSSNNKLVYLYLEALIKDDQLSEASALIKEKERLFPHNLKLQQLKAEALIALKDYEAALEVMLKCKPILRNRQQSSKLAELYYQTGNYDKAIEILKDLLKETPHAETLNSLADCYFRNKEFKTAAEYYQQACKKGWTKKQTLNQLAHSLRHTKQYIASIEIFKKILLKDRSCSSSILGLGACLEAIEQYDEALSLYRTSPLWKSRDPLVLRQAGICSLHLKRYRFAEIYLQKSLQQDSAPLQTFLFLASSLEKQAKWQEAESVYFKLVNNFPDHVAGYRGLAWLFGVGLSSNLAPETGISMAKRSLELLNNATSWEILSACEARAGNFSEAHHIQECLSSQSEDKPTRRRRQQAMRALRKKIPLNESLVSHNLVA
ncbi:MAG: tetratricopeptide repeat protein [Chlamydiales bacterium]|nr:tetratricopeptide repeat protein [Chlamydiales bacterium]